MVYFGWLYQIFLLTLNKYFFVDFLKKIIKKYALDQNGVMLLILQVDAQIVKPLLIIPSCNYLCKLIQGIKKLKYLFICKLKKKWGKRMPILEQDLKYIIIKAKKLIKRKDYLNLFLKIMEDIK